MSGWRNGKLGDVLTLQRGFDLPASARREGCVPVVSSSGVTGFHDEAKVQGPGVVIGRYGTLGEVHFVSEDFWPLNTSLYVKDFKGNDRRYCAYLLRTIAMTSTAAAVPGVNRNILHQLPVRYPDLPTQRRIASILGAYDDLIEVNRRRITLLEEVARRLFEEWFVRFRFPGHEDRVTALPQAWKPGIAGDLIDFEPATAVEKDGQKPFIPMNSLSTDNSLIEQIEWREGNAGAKFMNCDTLFARITPCLENGKTGIVRNLPGKGIGFGSTEFVVMRGSKAGPAFTYLLARNEQFRQHARRSMSGASGRQRARTESLRTYELHLPPVELLNRFEEVTWPLLELSGALGVANNRLVSSRDLLLPRLISGDLLTSPTKSELEAVA